ncbi:hypothetical protein SS50377_20521 [Spironucleus salmonicida]|uniref:Uncharacterized protein n=1 Tax=Spironucleus salmonicida TaxID=348837 RepID=V6LH10_9EUKA|nr:hypothetical protein SS50377_20521 [Spironucleus salmonicida]|eukprot:EST43812.1 Hypothetical protein SS50377_16432 [Spironucleus salmonicida]
MGTQLSSRVEQELFAPVIVCNSDIDCIDLNILTLKFHQRQSPKYIKQSVSCQDSTQDSSHYLTPLESTISCNFLDNDSHSFMKSSIDQSVSKTIMSLLNEIDINQRLDE